MPSQDTISKIQTVEKNLKMKDLVSSTNTLQGKGNER